MNLIEGNTLHSNEKSTSHLNEMYFLIIVTEKLKNALALEPQGIGVCLNFKIFVFIVIFLP